MTIDLIPGVVIPLLTIAASGVASAVVTFRLNARLQRGDTLRGKLEEAYIAAHDYCTALGIHFLKYLRVFTGEIDIDQANDLTIGHSERVDGTTFRRLKMLVSIYVSPAEGAFESLVELRDKLNDVVSAHRRRYLEGEAATPDLVPVLRSELQRLDSIEAELTGVIVREPRKL